MDIISLLLAKGLDAKITEHLRPIFEEYAEDYHFKNTEIKDVNGNYIYEGDALCSEKTGEYYYVIFEKGRYIAKRIFNENIELTFLYENVEKLKLHVIMRQYTLLI